jgi:hypothetical protein
VKDLDIGMSYLTQILAVGNLFNHRHTYHSITNNLFATAWG